jgi:hypothetical protein
MRQTLIICALLTLAGCSGSPTDYGITGPGPPPALPVQDDSTIDRPGIADPGTSYGPSVAPTTGSGRFFNYN